MDAKQGVKNRLDTYRNPVYIVYALFGAALLILSALMAESGVNPLESSLFYFFNNLGSWLEEFFLFISLFGSIGMVIVISLIALLRKHYDNFLKILLAGAGAYITAYLLKTFEIRPRPYAIIDNVIVRGHSIGEYGFPSGHVAVATALAIIAYQYLPKKWHKSITTLATLVAISRLYLGVHLPLDLIGGFAIGLIIGGIINFVFGSRKLSLLDPKAVVAQLKSLGVPIKSVEPAAVDTRRSTPYFGTMKNGDKIFIKIVSFKNNIADWLFRSWHKIIYRRLEDEAPFLNAKRQLEHETYMSNLALVAGVRTPKVIGIFEVGVEIWAYVREAITGNPLNKAPKAKLTDEVLTDIWRQVQIMHDSHMVHRDLRCANIFLAEDGNAWIIDFGFSETTTREEAKQRDLAELLASMSTLVGVKRTVDTAKKVVPKEQLQPAAAYLSYSVLSSVTTSELKKNRSLLPKLREEIAKQLKVKTPKQVRIQRVSTKNLIIIVGVILTAIFIAPRIGEFEDSALALEHARLWLVGVAAILPLFSYFFASLSYRSLIFYPIKQIRLFLIQIASSFASKIAPAGIGGLALNTWFLTKNNHTPNQATSVVAMNSLMGFLGHMTLLGMASVFGLNTLKNSFSLELDLPTWAVLLVLGGVIGGIVLLIILPKLRNKIVKIISETTKNFKLYRQNPSRLVGSLAASMLNTLSYCGVLYASAHALGSTLSPLQTVVVLTVGVVTAAVTPTPGGVGGAEAGLTAALVSAGMAVSPALSVALLFRLVTFWLPMIPAFFALQYVVKEEYI